MEPSAVADTLPAGLPLASFEKARVLRVLRTTLTGREYDPPTIGRYRVRSVVGRGAMGIVYLAHDATLQRDIALKVVPGDEPTSDSILAEALTLARVVHPNVVTVHDAGRHGDSVYIAMEYVRGLGLDRWIESKRPSGRTVIHVMLQAARGLAAAHAAGVVHRDFKPANVVVADDGRARIVDFGLARRCEPRLREPTSVHTAPAGTPAYMAPEQRLGAPPTPASDQYSFCVSFYEALTGHRPPRQGWERTIAPLLKPIIARGLDPDPHRRHPSMDALVRRFEGRRALWWSSAMLASTGAGAMLATLLAGG